MRATSLVSLALPAALALFFVPGCLRDFEQFSADDSLGGGTNLGGSPNRGSGGDSTSGGSSSGGSASGGDTSSGGSDNGGCGAGKKLCGGECIPNNDPLTGCAEESCNPCPNASHAAVGCDAGMCAILSCDAGYVSCDDDLGNGCEHSPSTFSKTACGGCDADCTALGLQNCSAGQCGCTTDVECQNGTTKDVLCNAGTCECNSAACQPGETCIKNAATSKCACGGGAACSTGFTCCPTAAGASCAQLDGSDVNNCGACGWQCADGEICSAGTCVAN